MQNFTISVFEQTNKLNYKILNTNSGSLFCEIEKFKCSKSDLNQAIPVDEIRAGEIVLPLYNLNLNYPHIYYSKSYKKDNNTGYIIHDDGTRIQILEFPNEAPIIEALYMQYINGYLKPLIEIKLKSTNLQPLIITQKNRQIIPQ